MTVTQPSRCDRYVTHAVSHTTPTRPDPTRPHIKTRVAGSTTSSGYVPARHRDGVVSATRLDEHTDLTTIEHLDFVPTLPCEHRQHRQRHDDEPAKYLVASQCPSCHDHGRLLLCASGWARLMQAPKSKCQACGHLCHAADALTILGTLP